MGNPLPIEFVREGDDILLRLEEYDTERRIHMGQFAAPADMPASPLGHSVGRWEGSSLMVATTRLSWPYFNQLEIPQSEDSVLAERFTPTPDGSRLDYELIVTDPVNFLEPVTLSRHWLYLPDERIMPYRCTENN